MWSTGTGSEVMQRIAVPMIGGMVSSTLLTLIVIPAIYALTKGWRLPAGRATETVVAAKHDRGKVWSAGVIGDRRA
jgi:Cu(I)/Ag(I) efflux system membrane protein CusA/SilA